MGAENVEIGLRLTGSHSQECHRVFPGPRVGSADDRDLGDRRQLEQRVDLGGGDVDAIADDHVLLAVGDGEPAVLEHPDVAGGEPPVGIEELVGERIVGVPGEQVGTAGHDFPGVAGRGLGAAVADDADLDPGEPVTIGARAPCTWFVGCRAGDGRNSVRP